MNLPLAILITGTSVALVYQGIADPAGGIVGQIERVLSGAPQPVKVTTSHVAQVAGTTSAGSPGGGTYNQQVPASARGGAAVVAEAQQWLGVPYKWGGNTKAGVDCSGFTTACLKAAGVQLPRTAALQEISKLGTTVSASNAQPGDLIFYGLPAHHVAVYVGGDQQIAAPHTGSVVKLEPVGSNVTLFRRFA